MALGQGKLHVVGVGGTLREHSTSRWALERALQSAAEAGASTELLALNDLRLPMYEPGKRLAEYTASVQRFVEAARRADAMIWSTAAYHGTLASVTKNALEFIEFLSKDARPYLSERTVGLIATAGGDIAAVNAIGAMVHMVHSLRGNVAPLLVPIPVAQQVFDTNGEILDPKWLGRLDQLGKLVVTSAQKWQPLAIELGA
ncbi:MAG: NAD(P)H-dependent oxidoreductase [Chloroflexota bacterium]|nr:NAD(P)H-dependent oxidoreductase [Chloroflexota bacterium]